MRGRDWMRWGINGEREERDRVKNEQENTERKRESSVLLSSVRALLIRQQRLPLSRWRILAVCMPLATNTITAHYWCTHKHTNTHSHTFPVPFSMIKSCRLLKVIALDGADYCHFRSSNINWFCCSGDGTFGVINFFNPFKMREDSREWKNVNFFTAVRPGGSSCWGKEGSALTASSDWPSSCGQTVEYFLAKYPFELWSYWAT